MVNPSTENGHDGNPVRLGENARYLFESEERARNDYDVLRARGYDEYRDRLLVAESEQRALKEMEQGL